MSKILKTSAVLATLVAVLFVLGLFTRPGKLFAAGESPRSVCIFGICVEPVGDWPHAVAFRFTNTNEFDFFIDLWIDDHAQPDLIDTTVAPILWLHDGYTHTLTVDTWARVRLPAGAWIAVAMPLCSDWQVDLNVVDHGTVPPVWDGGWKSEPDGPCVAPTAGPTLTPAPAMTSTPSPTVAASPTAAPTASPTPKATSTAYVPVPTPGPQAVTAADGTPVPEPSSSAPISPLRSVLLPLVGRGAK